MKNVIIGILALGSVSAFSKQPLIEVSKCKIDSSTYAIIYDQNGNKIEQYISIKQDKDVILNQEQGLRGLNRFFNLTVENTDLIKGMFLSTGAAIESNYKPSKRIINNGLIEAISGAPKRLAVLQTTDSVVVSTSFKAKLTILSETGEPNIKVYKLHCINTHN